MSNNTALVATIAGVSAMSVLLLTPLLRSSKQTPEPSSQQQIVKINDIDDIDDDNNTSSNNNLYITPEDVIKIFDVLFLQMQSVVAQLSSQIQQLQMQGQTIPEAQLRQLLKAEFERALLAKQDSVFEDNDVDEACLRDATWEFMAEGAEKYPKVKKAVERFQKLYENITGERVVGRLPDDSGAPVAKALSEHTQDKKEDVVSKERMLAVSTVYFEALTDTMRTIVKKLKGQGLNLSDPGVAQQMQMQFAMVANDAGEEALKGEGVSMDTFQKSVQALSGDAEVARHLTMLQLKQQEVFKAMGVP